MKDPDRKTGKVLIVFVGICLIAIPVLVLTAFSSETGPATPTDMPARPAATFDNNGGAVFDHYTRMSGDYMNAISSERTMAEYYSRRQYPGSPPFIPHKVAGDTSANCLSCHAKGGWSAEFKRHSPVTPHPEQLSCRQCHVKPVTEDLFVTSNWVSVNPPRLGRSYLPGSPPPVPHSLQMRGDCIACHVGPGAVAGIRVDHPARGNCRQCHVPDLTPGLFTRKPKP